MGTYYGVHAIQSIVVLVFNEQDKFRDSLEFKFECIILQIFYVKLMTCYQVCIPFK